MPGSVVAFFASQTIGALIAKAVISMVISSIVSSIFTRKPQNKAAAPQGINQSTRQAITAWQVIYGQCRVGSAITFMEATADNQNLLVVYTVAGHPCQEVVSGWADDASITWSSNAVVEAPYAGYMNVYPNLGDDAQPFSELITLSDGKWTDEHRQAGRTKVFVNMTYNADVYPGGLPNLTFNVKGKLVLDPRTGSTAWSDNPALCLLDYLIDDEYGLGADYDTEIDTASFIAAANICEESVSLADGTTEDRYTCNGAFSVDQSPENVLADLLSSMAGKLTYTNGKWVAWAGAYVTPVLTLTDSDLAGPISISPRLSKRDTFNSVKGTFAPLSNNYTNTDYPAVFDSPSIEEDNGEVIWSQHELPFTKSSSMAQRLAKIALGRVRRQMNVMATWKMKAYRLQACDTVMLTIEKYGWESKVFEVEEMTILSSEENGITTQMLLRETDSNVYAWAVGDEVALAPAPSTRLPDPFHPTPPGAMSFAEAIHESIGSSGVKVLLAVSWEPSSDYFAQSGLARYLVEYRLSGATDWVSVPTVKSTTAQLYDLAPGLYEFRVTSINGYGVSSSPQSAVYRVIGLSDPPATPSGFTVTPAGGLAYMKWDAHPDLDVLRGGVIEIRHSVANSWNWYDSILIDEYTGGSVSATGPLLAGTYMARAKDSSGIYSNSYASFPAKYASLIAYTQVASIEESWFAFTGSKANLTVGSLSGASVLQLTDPTSNTGIYTFPGSIAAMPGYVDCGSSASRRVELSLSLSRFDTGDMIDSRGLVDDWTSVDGGGVDVGNVSVYARGTDDDPAGTPTWSDWARLIVGEFPYRAYQFKAIWSTEADTHQISATVMRVAIKKA